MVWSLEVRHQADRSELFAVAIESAMLRNSCLRLYSLVIVNKSDHFQLVGIGRKNLACAQAFPALHFARVIENDPGPQLVQTKSSPEDQETHSIQIRN
jgi:hypothetical protein